MHLLHERVDDLCSALSAASARMESLEVDVAIKQSMVATSQAAAERRLDTVCIQLSALSEKTAAKAASLQQAVQMIDLKQDRLLDAVCMMQQYAESHESHVASLQVQHQAAIESIANGGGVPTVHFPLDDENAPHEKETGEFI